MLKRDLEHLTDEEETTTATRARYSTHRQAWAGVAVESSSSLSSPLPSFDSQLDDEHDNGAAAEEPGMIVDTNRVLMVLCEPSHPYVNHARVGHDVNTLAVVGAVCSVLFCLVFFLLLLPLRCSLALWNAHR